MLSRLLVGRHESSNICAKRSALRPLAHASKRTFSRPLARKPSTNCRRGSEPKKPRAPSKNVTAGLCQTSMKQSKKPGALSNKTSGGLREKPVDVPPAKRKKHGRPLAPMRPSELVGSVHESDADHWTRHSGQPSAMKCSRCHFIRHQAELQRVAPWCQPRPAFMGGHWRLGCDVCQWRVSSSTKEHHTGRRGSAYRANVFAKFRFWCHAEYRIFRDRLDAHATTAGHRISAMASQRVVQRLPARLLHDAGEKRTAGRPLATEGTVDSMEHDVDQVIATESKKVVSDVISQGLSDSLLLKGRVPQVADWIDAWAECTEQVAFHKQSRVSSKKGARRWNNLRKVRRKQVQIIAEVRREDIRHQLREATFISLSMDDRQYQKIVRFRCDAPKEPFVHGGILGVLSLEKSAVGDFEEDHALIAVRKLDAFLNRACTPLCSRSRPLATDLQLKEHIRNCTRVFAADGASKERRALLLAVQNLFPNVVLLLRDSAHALRIAIKDPLHFDELFGEVWTLLFDKRHALVPDVMNSKKWQDLLQHIQTTVLRIPCENRPLAVVLKHLRFAKQRFDSSADPMAKVAFMLLPLATLLAFIGSDERHKPCDRERAKSLLKKLDSRFALAIGVSADWGLVCQAFLRLFDKTDHDIAKTHSEIHAFKEALRILFDEGGVFSSRGTRHGVEGKRLPAIGGHLGIAGVKPMFVTQWIEETLRKRVVFNCGSEQVLLWGAPKVDDVKEIAERLKFVTAHVLDRVDADFRHLQCFACFDVSSVRSAFGCQVPAEALRLQQSLQRKVRGIAQDLGVDGTTAASEYRQVAPLILVWTSPGQPLATKSNSAVWQRVLQPDVCLSHLPQLRAMQALHVLIRFYISIDDGECPVERDLGVLSKFLHEHKNSSNDLLDDLMLVKNDSTSAADICERGDLAVGSEALAVGSPALAVHSKALHGAKALPFGSKALAVGSKELLGAKGRRWATLWRDVYGARLGILKKTGSKRGKRAGTYTAAKAGVLAAAEYAVAARMGRSDAQEHDGDDVVTPLGVRKSFFRSALGDKAAAYSNKRLTRFAAWTEAKRLKAQPFLNRCIRNNFQHRRAAKIATPLENIRRVSFLGSGGEPLPHTVSADTAVGVHEVTGGKRTLRADLVVVDSLSRVFECAEDGAVLQVMALVGRGLPVITKASWVLAGGDPSRVPKESVLRYRPLAMEAKCVFEYDAHCAAREPSLVHTLKELSAMPGSTWVVWDSRARGPCTSVGHGKFKGYELVKLGGLDVVRSWLQTHRRIHNVLGPKAWTLPE